MQKWEYQTLVVKIGRDTAIEVIQMNSKDTKAIEPGGLFKEPTYLAEAGREGWEVAGTSTLTHNVASSGMGDGKNRVMIILKRPLET